MTLELSYFTYVFLVEDLFFGTKVTVIYQCKDQDQISRSHFTKKKDDRYREIIVSQTTCFFNDRMNHVLDWSPDRQKIY